MPAEVLEHGSNRRAERTDDGSAIASRQPSLPQEVPPVGELDRGLVALLGRQSVGDLAAEIANGPQ